MEPEQAAQLLCANVIVYSPLEKFRLKESGIEGWNIVVWRSGRHGGEDRNP